MSSEQPAVVYDGSLAGLLCVVFDVFAVGLKPARVVRSARFAPSMFEEPIRVATQPKRARRVWTAVKKLDSFDSELVLRCWLYDTTQSDGDLVHLLGRVFKEGSSAARDFRDEAVMRCERVYRKMFREIHRTHAFVRFAEAEDGLYLARIAPDFDVLPLAVEHFEQRYQDQEWMIWDEARNYGFWFRPGQGKSLRVSQKDFTESGSLTSQQGAGFAERHTKTGLVNQSEVDKLPKLAAREDGFQDLWGTYFESVDIHARANPKLHKAHVPVRYWKHLTEKQPKNTGP